MLTPVRPSPWHRCLISPSLTRPATPIHCSRQPVSPGHSKGSRASPLRATLPPAPGAPLEEAPASPARPPSPRRLLMSSSPQEPPGRRAWRRHAGGCARAPPGPRACAAGSERARAPGGGAGARPSLPSVVPRPPTSETTFPTFPLGPPLPAAAAEAVTGPGRTAQPRAGSPWRR